MVLDNQRSVAVSRRETALKASRETLREIKPHLAIKNQLTDRVQVLRLNIITSVLGIGLLGIISSCQTNSETSSLNSDNTDLHLQSQIFNFKKDAVINAGDSLCTYTGSVSTTTCWIAMEQDSSSIQISPNQRFKFSGVTDANDSTQGSVASWSAAENETVRLAQPPPQIPTQTFRIICNTTLPYVKSGASDEEAVSCINSPESKVELTINQNAALGTID